MDEDTLLMSMLLDFFGELLTEKQREYFDLYYNEDLTLSEIAVKAGISKQGVHDMIARAKKTLLGLEEKTNVVKRWRETQARLALAESAARELLRLSEGNGEAAELARSLVLTLEGIDDYGI